MCSQQAYCFDRLSGVWPSDARSRSLDSSQSVHSPISDGLRPTAHSATCGRNSIMVVLPPFSSSPGHRADYQGPPGPAQTYLYAFAMHRAWCNKSHRCRCLCERATRRMPLALQDRRRCRTVDREFNQVRLQAGDRGRMRIARDRACWTEVKIETPTMPLRQICASAKRERPGNPGNQRDRRARIRGLDVDLSC